MFSALTPAHIFLNNVEFMRAFVPQLYANDTSASNSFCFKLSFKADTLFFIACAKISISSSNHFLDGNTICTIENHPSTLTGILIGVLSE